MKIEPVTPTDLDQIVAIERAGFTPEEAGTPAAFKTRIANLADTFLVARDEANTVQGFIVGPAADSPYVLDAMYETSTPNPATGGNQLVLSLAVAPTAQHQHLGSQLLAALEAVARKAQRETISLTCLDRLVPFYEQNGFHNDGVADSDHAGEIWTNMVKPLR
ncbi:GNAT family acetyltransferase [Secundilactobacillus paracollinoides]|uniref:GNAT family acetyltransferase n=1 Tax=Secundilactobacillus paracollinoides TaxID=240427 RepID=A0A1B2IXX6_9LACO|nr:GNAT family N-acetyltransferase [Secundilactobacillus paracollinoides]ANZ61013.1 GNAT family acetyltransferase [Secundilactobacillus paracollinoides]ANZ64624.1 GNAT family acetyltransferase [Secundilactobacillus paracollinoides]ANZ66870.1 GNAT family acetyltransferase [Secundilactobacillus paracollinoides]KRL79544.1 acetyltransferase [Secundilactobacillus paracollinoides DSM 15502 = JCM 11969]